MKPIYLILLILVCSSFANTSNYPVARLYAFKQKISGGANAANDKRAKSEYQEYIYLSVKQNRAIHIDHVWIDGLSVNFTAGEVKSPVMNEAGVTLSGKPNAQIIIPETLNTILQLHVDKKTEAGINSIPEKYKKYPLLIQYSVGTSIYFLGSKNWKTLAAKVNQ